MIESKIIGGVSFWFFTEQLLVLNADRTAYERLGSYVCYFNFEEPTEVVHGELLIDEKGAVRRFQSTKEAIEAATAHVKKKWNL
ncbi:MAG: hypothetical protein Q8K60_03410 [Parachlamydiaceae bacterium]|nr:hypothetical protein [Parachlamydiaceae bacterium]